MTFFLMCGQMKIVLEAPLAILALVRFLIVGRHAAMAVRGAAGLGIGSVGHSKSSGFAHVARVHGSSFVRGF